MDLRKWQSPTKGVKDPEKQRWAEIKEIMDTHLNGICPLFIYINRRPLESQESYAIDYRANNFEPLTMSAFKTALSSISDICQNSNIVISKNQSLDKTDLIIDGQPIEQYIHTKLITERENDPNAVIFVVPQIRDIEGVIFVDAINLALIPSSDIDYISENNIRIKIDSKILGVKNGQYYLESKDKSGNIIVNDLIFISEDFKPFIRISNNVVKEGKYQIRLPYLFGSASWGNKFYGQESDFSISATRYTYIKEIRAKEPCSEPGAVMMEGKHCYGDGSICKSCHGLGYVKDDSPLSTIYVDYDKLTSDGNAIPQFITYTEPPQGAITHSEQIAKGYYDEMLNSLGLIKQNMTNQSGISKSFDWMQKIKTVSEILNDNLRVLGEIYNSVEKIINPRLEPTSNVKLIGEIADNSINGLLERLQIAKQGQSPMNVIYNLVEHIILKTNNSEFTKKSIEVAKKYDILFAYGSDELIKAKAQLGSVVGIKEVVIHNTIIDVLNTFFENNIDATIENAETYLDNYYIKYSTLEQNFM